MRAFRIPAHRLSPAVAVAVAVAPGTATAFAASGRDGFSWG
ncbi:hypothetical protein [Streptomyces anulatus]